MPPTESQSVATATAIATLQRELTDHRVRLGWAVVDTSVEQVSAKTLPKDPSVWPIGYGDGDIWPNTPDALDRAIAAQVAS